MDKESFFKLHKKEFIIAFLGAVLSTFLGVGINVINEGNSKVDTFIISLCFFILVVQLGILFNAKKIFDQRFKSVNSLLSNYFGYDALTNDFYRRQQHFSNEKKRLSHCLVEKLLPNIINKLVTEKEEKTGSCANINIILDAGSTIASVFSLLPVLKQKNEQYKEQFVFYTNNLAGLDELQKRRFIGNTELIKECQVNVFGGHPLHDYRAITGNETVKSVKDLDPGKKDITIGIVTGNWIMAGSGLDKIKICARGAGHLEFKEEVIKKSDFVIVMCPLAKIIRCDSITFLNKIRQYHDVYKTYEIPKEKKDTVCLLTTSRQEGSQSPLRSITIGLENVCLGEKNQNYHFAEEMFSFEPEGNEKQIKSHEFPHDYVLDNLSRLYEI